LGRNKKKKKKRKKRKKRKEHSHLRGIVMLRTLEVSVDVRIAWNFPNETLNVLTPLYFITEECMNVKIFIVYIRI